MRRVVVFESDCGLGISDAVNDFISDSCGRFTLVNVSISVYAKKTSLYPEYVYVGSAVYEVNDVKNNI